MCVCVDQLVTLFEASLTVYWLKSTWYLHTWLIYFSCVFFFFFLCRLWEVQLNASWPHPVFLGEGGHAGRQSYRRWAEGFRHDGRWCRGVRKQASLTNRQLLSCPIYSNLAKLKWFNFNKKCDGENSSNQSCVLRFLVSSFHLVLIFFHLCELCYMFFTFYN